MKMEVELTNGRKHNVVFDGSKTEFFDLLKFSRDTFLQDTNSTYFIVSSIMAFKIIGGNNG